MTTASTSCNSNNSALDDGGAEGRIVIVGAGIVGSCLAHLLATASSQQVVLVDRDVHGLAGSTGHAPGYVGQYNQIAALTTLARRSVAKYLDIPHAFRVVGGLEIAQSHQGVESLQQRCQQASAAGLKARMLTAEEAVDKAPFFVRADGSNGALWFEQDGTADAQLIARHEQAQAKANGAVLIDAEVEALLDDASTTTSSNSSSSSSSSSSGVVLKDGTHIQAGKVVLCTGIWTRTLLPSLPIVPVAHPYCYTAERSQRRDQATPFVRYPEAHVYVRDHGRKDGIGSYAHDPIAVADAQLTTSAYGEWHSAFQPVLNDALALLPPQTSSAFAVNPADVGQERVFNGLFSVTPDGMPLVGKVHDRHGVYVAAAVWVTHAAAAAQLIAHLVLGTLQEQDQWLVRQLDPHRFDGKDAQDLESQALGTYNDIYNKKAPQL